MRLLRLLTAGKSLVGLQGSDRHFRPSHPGALPRFQAKQNPFRATSTPEPTVLAMTSANVIGSLPARDSGAAALTARPQLTATASTCAHPTPATGSSASAPQPTPTAKGAGWLRRSAAKVSAWFARAPKPAKPAMPQFNPPLQGELSLDSVKVVRNDLSDSDLEVVPAKAVAAPVSRAAAPVPVSAAQPPTASPEAAPRHLGPLGARLFGASKTLS